MSKYEQDGKLLMTELLRFSPPKEPIESQWGYIPYELYLMLEKKRIEEDPERVAVIITREKKVALFVNRIAGDPELGDIWLDAPSAKVTD